MSTRTGPFTGTAGLLRLNLRLDRVRLISWVLGFVLLIPASVVALREAFPDQESLDARAQLQGTPGAIVMTGPQITVDGPYTFEMMVATELSLWVLLPAMIMSVLLMVRHTRGEEESGRLEMLRALPIGRHAAPTAASLVVAIANLAVGAAVSAGLILTDLTVADSLAMGVAVTLTGLVAGAFAAVMAQIAGTSRGATGLGLSAIAVAFVVRGIGDVLEPGGSWLSWFSPIAWAQQTRFYADLRWWPLAVSALAVVVLTVAAVALSRRRDLGASLSAERAGRSEARGYLRSVPGLAARLETPMIATWTVVVFAFAFAFGTLATEFDTLLEQAPEMAEWIEFNEADLARSFGALLLAFLALAPIILLVAAVLRLRTEETAGRGAGLLTTGSSRPGLLGGWYVVAAIQASLCMVVLGFGLGLGMAVASGDGSWIGEITLAALAYLPVLLLFGALAAALYGMIPKLTWLAWVLVGWTALVLFLGELLGLPDWARALSPLWHVPNVPDASLTATPLIVLTVLVVVLAAAGLLGFRRRDIAEG